jgi:hypothetical protein
LSEERGNAQRILVGIPGGGYNFGDDIITYKLILKPWVEIGHWIHVAQDVKKLRAVVNTVMSL